MGFLPPEMCNDLVLVLRSTGVVQLYAAVVDLGDTRTGFWTSLDGRSSWTHMGASFVDHATGSATTADFVGPIRLAVDPRVDAPAGVLAAVGNSKSRNMLDIMRLASGGSTWRSASGVAGSGGLPVNVDFQYGSNLPITMSSSGAVVLGTSTTGVFRTLDGGALWAQIPVQTHVDGHALTTVGDVVYYGNDGGIFRFDPKPNGSAGEGTWTSLNSGGLQTHLLNGVSPHPTNPFVALVGSQDNSTALSSQGTWSYVGGGDTGRVRFDPDPMQGGKYAYFASPPDPDPKFLFRSDTEGKENSWMPKGFSHPECMRWFPIFTIHPNQTQRLLVGLGRVYETQDRGDHWNPISPVFIGKDVEASAIEYGGDDGTIYVGYASSDDPPRPKLFDPPRSKLFVTSDGGTNWAEMVGTTIGLGLITGIAAWSPTTLYVVCSNGTVWRARDMGASWTELTTNLPRIGLNTVAVHGMGPNNDPWVFVGTDVGVYAAVDRDMNTSWARYGSGFPDVKVKDLQIVPGRDVIAAATWGRGAFTNHIDGSDLPDVAIIERRDSCMVATVVGEQGHFHATIHGFSAGVEYRWDTNATVIGRIDLPDLVIQAPAAGTSWSTCGSSMAMTTKRQPDS